MKQKQVFVLGLILVFLLLGVTVQKLNHPKELFKNIYSPLGFHFDNKAVRRITIRKKAKPLAETITLDFDSGNWRVKEFWDAAADPKKIRQFLSVMGRTRGELRASDEGLLQDFGITDDEAIEIALWGEGENNLMRFYLSLKRPGQRGSFVRPADSPDVFYADTDFLGFLGLAGDGELKALDPEVWAKLDPLSGLDAEELQSVSIFHVEAGKRSPVNGFTRDQKEGQKSDWRFIRQDLPFPMEASKVTDYLDVLAHIRAEHILDPVLKNEKIKKTYWQAELKNFDGKSRVIRWAKPEGESRTGFLAVEGEGIFYEISNYALDDLTRQDSRFFKNNPLGIEKTAVEKIILNSGKQSEILQKDNQPQVFNDYIERLKRLEMIGMKEGDEGGAIFRGGAAGTVEIYLRGGSSSPLILEWGILKQESGHGYFLRMAGQNFIFGVSEYTYQELLGSLISSRTK